MISGLSPRTRERVNRTRVTRTLVKGAVRTILFWALALALLPRGSAAAQELSEEILSYDVRIEIGNGGTMRVSESIEVRALGQEIRRGIYRDFPTHFPREEAGGRIVAPFTVLSVSRDGLPEPYELERIIGPSGRGGVRVRVGDPDIFLDQGLYTYALAYRTERWLRFEETEDALYWNVTGNGWVFPIASATATVILPGVVSATDVDLSAWTGPEGSERQDVSWRWDPEVGGARFQTTRSLDSYEGLTIRVRFPTGVVAPPTAEQEAAWFRLDWGGYVDAAALAALVVALYLAMWIRVGRDPAPGAIMVEYEPPEGFSPAALGFLRERGYESAQLNAAFVSLAVKGAVTIEKDGNDWRIRSTGVAPAELSREERTLYDELVAESGTLTLSGSPNERLRKAVKKVRAGLRRRLETHYFVTNRRWFLAGAGISLGGFGLLAWSERFSVSPEIWFLGFWLSFWTLGVATLLYRVWVSWRQAFSGDVLAGLGAGFLTLFALPFVAAEIFVGVWLYRGAPGHLMAAAIAVGFVNVLFYHLLERPTLKGRGVLDRLEGFRRYLGAAEGDVLDRLQEPNRSLELFERFLPYAIALEVENRWAERFERVLTPGAEAEARAGSGISWYSGGRSNGLDLSGMTTSLSGSFSTSLSASSAAPSGGGGGGGGSSGGGGGGGGGGGW